MAVFTELGPTQLGFPEEAPDRKIFSLGLRYEHRFWRSRIAEFHYAAEFRPVVVLQNTTQTEIFRQVRPTPLDLGSGTSLASVCVPRTSSVTYTDPAVAAVSVVEETVTCGREWDYGQAFAPAGFTWKFRPGKRLQPIAGWNGGVLFTTKSVPDQRAGSFNFTYQFGAGLEYYIDRRRSLGIRFDIHHFSNAGTAPANPSVDNGVLKINYSFGK